MGNEVDNKFKWLIKDLSFPEHKIISSDQFVIGGHKWHLLAYQNDFKSFCLDLELADCEYFPYEWRKVVKCSLTVVNYLSQKLSKQIGLTHWFDQKDRRKGLPMLPLSQLKDKQCGFLVDGEVEIVAQLNVCETFHRGGLAIDHGDAMVYPITKPKAEEPAGLVCVKGFRVLSSQGNLVKRIFEKYPETAKECWTKNQDLRTSYINVVFTLIKMLYKGPHEQPTEDLSDAERALYYMRNVGFKLDWLEKKLVEVKKYARVTEMEKQMQDLMDKYRFVQKELDKEMAEIKKAPPPDRSFVDAD